MSSLLNEKGEGKMKKEYPETQCGKVRDANGILIGNLKRFYVTPDKDGHFGHTLSDGRTYVFKSPSGDKELSFIYSSSQEEAFDAMKERCTIIKERGIGR